MIRSRVSKIAIMIGLIGLFIPSLVTNMVNLLPVVEHDPGSVTLRAASAMYLIAGIFIEAYVNQGLGPNLSRVSILVSACMTVMALIFLNSGGMPLELYLIWPGILIPLLAGIAKTYRQLLAALSLVLVPLLGGAIAIKPSASMALSAWFGSLMFTAYAIMSGLPLSLLGLEWRALVPSNDIGA